MKEGVWGKSDIMRDRVLAYLRRHSEDSISSIARAVSEGRDKPIHRLTVAGYLGAMADMGYLREIPRPPSKHYALANTGAHHTVYQRVGAVTRDITNDAESRARLVAAVLHHLFDRPPFAEEIRMASADPSGLPHAKATDQERRRFRSLVRERDPPDVDLPPRDPLIDGADLVPATALRDAVRRLALDASGANHLVYHQDRYHQLSLEDA